MKKATLCIVLLCFFTFFGCAKEPLTNESFVMNTFFTQQIYGDDVSLAEKNSASLYELEKEVSRTIENSEVHTLNNSPSSPVTVSEHTAYLLEQCILAAEKTNGAFNPALGSVKDAWGFGTDTQKVPSDQELSDLVKTTDYEKISTDGNTVVSNGATIDFGGAAKGYALDLLRQNTIESDVSSAIYTLGGSVYAKGTRPDGNLWTIGVRDPFLNSDDYLGTLQVQDVCVSTTGTYEQNFTQDGVFYHHVIDPKTLRPTDNNLASVVVVDESGLITDIYSTALFVMGLNEGLSYANENGLNALFITQDKEIFLTDSFPYTFTLEDSSYER